MDGRPSDQAWSASSLLTPKDVLFPNRKQYEDGRYKRKRTSFGVKSDEADQAWSDGLPSIDQ